MYDIFPSTQFLLNYNETCASEQKMFYKSFDVSFKIFIVSKNERILQFQNSYQSRTRPVLGSTALACTC